MYPYIIVFLLVFFGFAYEFYFAKQASNNKGFFGLIILIAALMTGLRDMIGGYDVYVYARYFDNIPTIFDLSSLKELNPIQFFYFEPGYLVLNSLIKTIWDNQYFLFFSISLLTYGYIGKTLSKYPLFYFSFFIFLAKFFIVGFVYTRQFIAMGIIWHGLQYLTENKGLKFFISLAIATSIHYSAIVVLPICFISKKTIPNKILFTLFLSSLILGVTPFIKQTVSFFNAYTNMDKASGYANAEMSGFHIPYFIETTILAICILKYSKELYANKKMAIVLNMLVLYVVFSFLTLRDGGLVRFIWYYALGYVVLIPFFFRKTIKQKGMIIAIALSYYSFVYFRNVIVRDDGNFLPYKSIFMDVKRVDKFS